MQGRATSRRTPGTRRRTRARAADTGTPRRRPRGRLRRAVLDRLVESVLVRDPVGVGGLEANREHRLVKTERGHLRSRSAHHRRPRTSRCRRSRRRPRRPGRPASTAARAAHAAASAASLPRLQFIAPLPAPSVGRSDLTRPPGARRVPRRAAARPRSGPDRRRRRPVSASASATARRGLVVGEPARVDREACDSRLAARQRDRLVQRDELRAATAADDRDTPRSRSRPA